MKEFEYICKIAGEKIPVVLGATASGKTDFAINLCQYLNGEIISIDSRQIYKNFKIGTNQPTSEELNLVSHHLINLIDHSEIINAFTYISLVKKSIKKIQSMGKKPVIVGGTLLYVYMLINDILVKQVSKNQHHTYKEKTNFELWSMLNVLDCKRASNIHYNDRKKVERAIDLIKSTGRLASDIYNNQENKINNDFYIIELVLSKKKLHDKIKDRFNKMINGGWIEEVQLLLNSGVNVNSHPMQGIGYIQIVQYLNNEINSDTMNEQILTKTRLFAKKQVTWLKKMNKDILIKNVNN